MTQKPVSPRPRNPLQIGRGAPSLPAQAVLASAEADDQDSDSLDAAMQLGRLVGTPAGSDDGYFAGMADLYSAMRDRTSRGFEKLSDSISMAEAVRQVTKGLSIHFICVCGLSGVGKSSFIKLVTGKQVHVEHSIRSGTTTFAMFPAAIDGQRFVFVDTPGFDDRHKTELEILEIILEWFEMMTPYVDLAGMVYVHDITKDRLGGAAELNLALIRAMAGPKFYKRIIFVTTKWDTLAAKTLPKAEARQRQLEEDPWKDMIDGGAQVFALYGVDETDGGQQVEEAMREARKMMGYYNEAEKAQPAIQEELRRKTPKRETSAAQVVLRTSPPPPEYEDDPSTTSELKEAVPLLAEGSAPQPNQKNPIEEKKEKKEQRKSWWETLVHAVLSFFGTRK